MIVNRKIIQIDEDRCDGCGNCVVSCAEGALKIINGKARVISDNLCDGLGACIGDCPQEALKITERRAEEFDEEAVEKHLESRGEAEGEMKTMACGCPSTRIQSLAPAGNCRTANIPGVQSSCPTGSALAHWPVQIRLVPPDAPFLKGADLLIVADCVPVAFPTLHRDLLPGKVVMIGCPKFDDAQDYIDRFARIFKTAGIKSVTVVVMEVPCCSGLPAIVEKGMEMAGVEVPLSQMTIGTRGERVLDS